MHRPTRQLTHLLAKIERKEAIAKAKSRKPGDRVKRWKKSAAQYKPLVEGQQG